MKLRPSFSLTIAAMATMLSFTSAFAASFSYSYTFNGTWSNGGSLVAGSIVSGTFDGTANGNLITGISNVTLNFDAYALPGYIFAEAIVNGNIEADGSAVVSFDGTENNILFSDFDAFNAPAGATTLFEYITPFNFVVARLYNPDWNHIYDEPIATANWQVTERVGAGVPDGGATITMIGFVLFGLAALRRRLI